MSPQTYLLMRNVSEKMRARNYPVRFEYAPDAVAREGRDLTIVVERDREQGDTLGAPTGAQRQADSARKRMLGCIARFYVKSSKPNATVWDHEELCDHVVDAFLFALYEWGAEGRAGDLPVTESRYLGASELKQEERWAGLVYQIRFKVPRGLRGVTYEGQGRPTGEASAVASRTDVSGPGADDDTGCGA